METLGGIQALRFLAALLVVIYHVRPEVAQGGGGLFGLVKNGGAGVDLFFVISGLIITLTALRKAAFDPLHFALNRFFRIYPVYWFFLLIAIALGWLAFKATGHSATHDMFSMRAFVASWFLLPIQTQLFPVAWTLTLEVSFYVIFCLTFTLAGMRGVIVAMLLWYLSARVYGSHVQPDADAMIWFFHSIVLEFSFGIWIALLWQKGWIRDAKFLFGLGLLTYAAAVGGVLDPIGAGREFIWGIPAALLICGVVGSGWRMPRWALVAGDSSYALYLSHPLVISIVGVLGTKFLGLASRGHPGVAVFVILASVMASIIFTLVIEAPYRIWYKRVIATWTTSKFDYS